MIHDALRKGRCGICAAAPAHCWALYYYAMQMHHGTVADRARRAQLKSVAEAYFSALERSDFSAIPYADKVTLRTPLTPGGVHKPLVGKAALEEIWWAPLKGAIGGVEVLDHYINDDASAICTQVLINIAGTDIVLRVVDRFAVDSEGRITEQENHFDPRDVTNPGWAAAQGR